MAHITSHKPIASGGWLPMLLACLLAMATTGCRGDKIVPSEDRTDSAIQTMLDAHARKSEKGIMQIELDAPRIEKYDMPRPVTKYFGRGDERVQLRVYDAAGNIKTTIEAGQAISYDDRDIMEAWDSVVVVDYRNNDTIYLIDLVWNSAEDRIYSEHTVRARSGNRLTEGDGFSSNQRMDDMHIVRQRGVIEFDD